MNLAARGSDGRLPADARSIQTTEILSLKSAIEELRDSFPVVLTLPVQWGEQDSFAHVNNIIYFRWCESARITYLERTGLWQMYQESGVGPILAAINLNYRRPVTYPDTVHIGARVIRTGNSSFTMEHRIVSEDQGIVVADGDSVLVVLDYNVNKTVPIPESVRKAIDAIESRSLSAP